MGYYVGSLAGISLPIKHSQQGLWGFLVGLCAGSLPYPFLFLGWRWWFFISSAWRVDFWLNESYLKTFFGTAPLYSTVILKTKRRDWFNASQKNRPRLGLAGWVFSKRGFAIERVPPILPLMVLKSMAPVQEIGGSNKWQVGIEKFKFTTLLKKESLLLFESFLMKMWGSDDGSRYVHGIFSTNDDVCVCGCVSLWFSGNRKEIWL